MDTKIKEKGIRTKRIQFHRENNVEKTNAYRAKMQN